MRGAITGGDAFAAMRHYKQFILVRFVPRADGGTDKFPINPLTGGMSDAHNPAIWLDAATAGQYADTFGPGFGIGFVFTQADPFFFIDIDGALDNAGAWSQFSTWLLGLFPTALVEVSQSGRGLHIIGRTATNPGPHRKKNAVYHCEYYTELRFVALTGFHARGDAGSMHDAALAYVSDAFFKPAPNDGRGDSWTDTPVAEWRGSTDDTELIRRARASRGAASSFGKKASFAELYDADATALGAAFPHATKAYDASSADMALAMHLMFWTGRDCERTERLMRGSALVREKWDDRGDYYLRDMTIGNAMRLNTSVCQDAPLAVFDVGPLAGGEVLPVMTPIDGATFCGAQQQATLFHGCVYVEDAHRVLVPGGKLLKPDQFRARYGGYSFTMDTANQRVSRNAFEAFTESQMQRSPRADSSCFQPRMTAGAVIERGGLKWANVYWPIETPRKQGDASPFLAHLAKLLPNEHDRIVLLSYLAAMVQHKGSKFQWAPLLQGAPGNGKSLISICIAEALGSRYIHWPKASKLSKEFNGWMLNKLAYLVEDIYTPAKREDEVMEDLKPMITGGKGLEIESKGVDQISADICGNFIFNMNKYNGVKKIKLDRRLSFFLTPQQRVEDFKESGMTGDYFHVLQNWLTKDGYAIVHDYLATFAIPPEFNPALDMGGRAHVAPQTSTTPDAIRNSASRVEQEIAEAIAQGRPGFARGWASYSMLGNLLKDARADSKFTPLARREMLADLGYVAHPGLHDGRTTRAVLPDGHRTQLWLLSGHPALGLQDAETITKAYEADNRI